MAKKKYATEEERKAAERERARKWRKANPARNRENVNRWKAANPERARRAVRAWKAANPERAREATRKWREANPYRHREYARTRRKTDVQFKLAGALRSRLGRAVRGSFKGGSAVRDLGCSVSEFKAYLESKFQPGMTWDNWAIDGWHIDHIQPLVSFDLTDPEQVKEACNYKNMQPLWAVDNLSKSDNR